MGPDDDLAKLLPEAPPRPDRRTAAINEALRRFDGGAPASGAPSWRPAFRWPKIGRAPLGVAMSMGLLAVIGVPLALRTVQMQEPAARAPEQARVEGRIEAAGAPPPAPSLRADRAASPSGKAPASAAVAEKAQPQPQPARPLARGEPGPSALVQADAVAAPAPAAPPPPAMPSAARSAPAVAQPPSSDSISVTGARAARRSYDSPTAVASLEARENDAGAIVVSGARASRAARNVARRGDWNACTVNDPGRRLDRCRRMVNPGAKGAAGQAAARIADGLTRAWQGDMTGAIAAFDLAIEIAPEQALGYLNRGLAYQHLGETERAFADFDRAVRYAPHDARGFYHRSVALRALGNDRRAQVDEERAINLDAQYRDLFD